MTESEAWKDEVLSRAKEKMIRRQWHWTRVRPHGTFQINASREFINLLHTAAKARDMKSSAYVRRAIAAFISADLGIALPDIVATCPAALPNDGRHVPRPYVDGKPVASSDDGLGYGPWIASGIENVRDEFGPDVTY